MHASHYSNKSNASGISKKMIEPGSAKKVKGGGNNMLLNEYEAELERLREENNQIRFTKDLRERDFENVMFENAQLQNKLENLENVFIGSAIPRDGVQRQGNSRVSNPANRNHMNSTPQDGLQQDYTTSNLMIENNDLKKRIFMLEQEKIEL